MRINLPLEVWVDVFAPIFRWELARLVDKLGSRQFAAIAMFFLHEYGQIKLGSRRGKIRFGGYSHLEMAEVEMPANIKDFEKIEICADFIWPPGLATFFTQFQPLLSNVNLFVDDQDQDKLFNGYKNCLKELFPFVKSFNSIHFSDPSCLEFAHKKFPDKFFSTKVLSINWWQIMADQRRNPSSQWPHLQNFDAENDHDNAEDEDNDEEITEEEIDGDEEKNIAKKDKYEAVSKQRLDILRQWLLFDGNIKTNNEDGIDAIDDDGQPRLLYVDDIPLNLCGVEMDNIVNEFMQFTKPFSRFVVRFSSTDYLDAEQRQNIESIINVNSAINQILSAKCFEIVPNERSRHEHQPECAIFLHCHPICPNGEEHAGNMLLINQIMESEPDFVNNDRFSYHLCRHIVLYNEGYLSDGDCYSTKWSSNDGEEEQEGNEPEQIMEEMNFLWQKELRIEAFERRVKSRKMALDKLNRKKNGSGKKEKTKSVKQKHGHYIEMIFGEID